jgi:outer membrane protein TolC
MNCFNETAASFEVPCRRRWGLVTRCSPSLFNDAVKAGFRRTVCEVQERWCKAVQCTIQSSLHTVPLALIALLVGSPPSSAQQTLERLTLSEAIARGLERSHRLGELDARRAGSEAAVQGARAGTLPQISLQGGYTRTNHVDPFGVAQPGGTFQVIYPDVPDNWRSRLDLQWPIHSGGRLEALTRAARADADAAARDVASARSDLRLDITRAYWNLVTARDAVTVVEQSLQRVRAHVDDTRARFDTGLVPPSDVSSAEAQRSLQEALLIETRNGARLANLALLRLLGLEASVLIEPTEPLGARPGFPLDPEGLFQEALRTRADRQAIDTRRALRRQPLVERQRPAPRSPPSSALRESITRGQTSASSLARPSGGSRGTSA